MTIGKEYSLQDVIEAAIQTRMKHVHFAIPGRIVDYDHVKQTATVEAVCRTPEETENGEVVYQDFPTFPEVPIAWPSGGGYFISFPLAKGDPVTLVFSDVACGEYLLNGKKADPLDTRRHSIGYPTAIPGGHSPDSNAAVDASADAIVIGKDGANQQIKIGASFIELGKGAADFVALASKVDAALLLIKTHLHPVSGAAAGLSTELTKMVTATGSPLVKVKA